MIGARRSAGPPGPHVAQAAGRLQRRRGGRSAARAANRQRRWRWVASVLAAGLVLAGCDAPRPDVTFFGNRTAVQTAPTHWCDVDESAATVSCADAGVDGRAEAVAEARAAGADQRPGAVGSTPWTVYFRYLDAKGELADGRSEVFTDGRLAYTLQTLAPEDQLTYVEVQSAFVLVPGEQGGVDFAATRAWLLLIDPLPAPGANEQ